MWTGHVTGALNWALVLIGTVTVGMLAGLFVAWILEVTIFRFVRSKRDND